MEDAVVIEDGVIGQPEYMIAKYLNTPQGRLALANAMIQPIRRNLQYAGLTRSVIQVTHVPPAPKKKRKRR